MLIEVNGSVDLVVGRGVGSGVGRVVGDEVYSAVGEGVELEVGGNVVSINISRIKLMWILETV